MCRIMTSLMAQRRNIIQSRVGEKETIHSGHFMVSHFEADAQDDEYEVAVPVPEVSSKKLEIIPFRSILYQHAAGDRLPVTSGPKIMSVSIETSLTKLFQCMSIAYRQKLTSPKWNRFKGVRLRWKEKIRLNNVIWRCWHMQFVMKRNIGVCQFASPLDVDVHSKPEAVVLEGKYWKRKLSAVTAEYKRWRIFYQKLASSPAREQCEALTEMIEWNSGSASNDSNMMMDEDYMDFMSDTLFSTITSNQPFAFPDTREIARGASLADFIQPSLVQLQPNLDDYMDMLEPLQDLLSPSSKLPSVPEEYHPSDDLYRSLNVNYEDVSTSSFYAHPTTSVMDSTASIAASANNVDQKFYVKLEQEQPLQLSVNQDLAGQKGAYRSGSNLYQESNPSSMYTNQSNVNSYPAYQTSNYHQQSTQSSQHSSAQDNAIVNYAHQLSNKNVPSAPTPISYNNASSLTSAHYPSYESTGGYNTSSANVQSSYLPSSSSNYKILPTARSARSGSLPMNTEEELFAVPKLAQRGRSRSGSSLIPNQGRYPPPDQCASESVTNSALLTQLLTNSRHYGYHGSYHRSSCGGSSPGHYSGGAGHDTRPCCTVNGHRPVAHCTALLGRRSRTPDHILCSNSNPVGYCKPRTPIISSQSCHEGSLINLSQNQREGSSDKSYKMPDTSNSPYAYSLRHSQCVPKASYDKYPNSTLFHSSSWAPSSAYHSFNTTTSSSSPSSVTPFMFGTQHSNADTSNLSQIMNNTSTSNSPKHPSSPSTSESLSLSPLTVSSPVRATPPSPTTKSTNSVTPYKEHRRVCHINAEQKRRCNIKNGFDTLHQLIPHLAQNPNTKMSKAAMLQKGADYIRTLRGERSQLREEIDSLKQQVDTLNSAISNCQSLLPATGAPISRHKADKMKEMFDDFVRERTKQNWKFWILSLIFEPLLSSFNSSVSNTSIEELFRTTIQWAEQYCSLVDLRPIVLNALRHVCTKTEVLANPNKLPDEAREVVLSSSRLDRN